MWFVCDGKLGIAYDVSVQHCNMLKLYRRIQFDFIILGCYFLWYMFKFVHSLDAKSFHFNLERGSIV